jgi:hypothetical protein
MKAVDPIVKAILITAAAVIPMTVVLNVTDASQAIIAPVVVLVIGACSAIGIKLYRDSKPYGSG